MREEREGEEVGRAGGAMDWEMLSMAGGRGG